VTHLLIKLDWLVGSFPKTGEDYRLALAHAFDLRPQRAQGPDGLPGRNETQRKKKFSK